jgi:hypothetical protein
MMKLLTVFGVIIGIVALQYLDMSLSYFYPYSCSTINFWTNMFLYEFVTCVALFLITLRELIDGGKNFESSV